MAKKLKNIGAAFKDTKSRTILIVVALIVIVGILIGWFGLKRAQETGIEPSARVQSVPGIKSIPGVGTSSREYAKAQEEENILKAQQAEQAGKSAIPTLIRPTYVGSSELQQPLAGTPPLIAGATSADCSAEALARARQAGVKAEELRCKGCNAAQLRAAGYTAGELMAAGFGAAELKAAGYSADELRNAGFTAAELARAGFTPAELLTAGYNAAELSQAGINAAQLSAVGVSADQLATAGVGIKPTNLPADCSPDALRQARANGVSAAALRGMGCGAAALRAAGYTAKELKDAGFNAKELRDAGFSAAELKGAGFSAGELREAGFSAADLKAAGFSANELRDAGYGASELAAAGYTANDLKAAGYSDGDLIRAGLAPTATVAAVPTTPAPSATPVIPSTTISTIAIAPEAPTPSVSIPSVTVDPSISALEKLQQRQAEQLSLQERQERIAQMQQLMGQQASDLFTSWHPPAMQAYVKGPDDDANQRGAGAQGNGGRMNGQAGAGTTGVSMGTAQPIIIKAGTVMFGVLQTSLNSDEPGPILAKIVSDYPCKGFKGSLLVGQFVRENKKVILSFNTMNNPGISTSIPIDAVAIDPQTARTALASHVNSHYLLRYGSLFASSFVSGLADAVSESGSTLTISTAGITETHPDLSTAEKGLVAVGEVGKQFGNVLSSVFTRPPTVEVNAGEGIGLLFRSDVTITPSPTAAETALPTAPVATPPQAAAAAQQASSAFPSTSSGGGISSAAVPVVVPSAPTAASVPSAVPSTVVP